jgi:hypothetical protein
VILSAGNTAAIASDATVKPMTRAVGRMASDKEVGCAEAIRQSMLALIDKGEAHAALPAFWAPFVLWARRQPRGNRKFRYRRWKRKIPSRTSLSGPGSKGWF